MRSHPRSPTQPPRDHAGRRGPSAGRRGLALVAGFWVVIVALLGARVALFDAIAVSRMAAFIGTQVASLSSLVLN